MGANKLFARLLPETFSSQNLHTNIPICSIHSVVCVQQLFFELLLKKNRSHISLLARTRDSQAFHDSEEQYSRPSHCCPSCLVRLSVCPDVCSVKSHFWLFCDTAATHAPRLLNTPTRHTPHRLAGCAHIRK